MRMQQRSPTLAGFRIALSRPSVGLAEIAWRWSFGFAAALLLTFSVVEYLDSLPVSYRDELMFRTRQPALISRAISHILRGSSLRVIAAAVLLAIALSIAWVLLSSLGRMVTVRALFNYFRESHEPSSADVPKASTSSAGRVGSLLGLNFFRVAATLAAVVGGVAAFLLAGAVSPADHPSPGRATLIFFFCALLVWLAWSTLNWFLSLAAIFIVADGCDTFGAIAATVGFCRDRTGSVLAANAWFELAHLVAFVVASSIVGFPVAFSGLLPLGVVLGGLLLVALAYFAVVDFLYVGRLSTYIAILELPEVVPSLGILSIPPASDFDRSELILSDLPNLLPEA
jgi:hypothetical protein